MRKKLLDGVGRFIIGAWTDLPSGIARSTGNLDGSQQGTAEITGTRLVVQEKFVAGHQTAKQHARTLSLAKQ